MSNVSGKAAQGTKTMNAQAAARIQSATARQSGGGVQKGSFAAKAQSVAARNAIGFKTGK